MIESIDFEQIVTSAARGGYFLLEFQNALLFLSAKFRSASLRSVFLFLVRTHVVKRSTYSSTAG